MMRKVIGVMPLYDREKKCYWIGHGKTTFPTVALGSLRGSLAFFWKGRGVQSPWLAISQTYLSALFSCQRAVAKACCFHVKAGQSRKEGDIKPCSAKNCLFFFDF